MKTKTIFYLLSALIIMMFVSGAVHQIEISLNQNQEDWVQKRMTELNISTIDDYVIHALKTSDEFDSFKAYRSELFKLVQQIQLDEEKTKNAIEALKPIANS